MDNKEILKKAGLNDAQAEVYDCLLKNGAMTPAELGDKTSQSRENCYAIIKKLIDMELIEQTDDKKASYRVLNPTSLEILVEKRRKIMAKNEKLVKENLSSLLDIFYANNEKPGSRTLEGVEGLKELYRDTLITKKDVYLFRTESDMGFWGQDEKLHEFFQDYLEQRALLGIHTFALTPVTPSALKRVKKGLDSALNVKRVWRDDKYDASVEIMVYGDKAALVSYGETVMATIITSPAIAEAMRQIIKIMMDFYKKNFKQDQK